MAAPRTQRWTLRDPNVQTCPVFLYGKENKEKFSVRLIHGGRFTVTEPRSYVPSPPKSQVFDNLLISDFCIELLDAMGRSLGYEGPLFFYRKHPQETTDYGLIRLQHDVSDSFSYIDYLRGPACNVVQTIYMETDHPTLTVSYPESLLHSSPAKIQDMLQGYVLQNPSCSLRECCAYLRFKYGMEIPVEVVEPGWLEVHGNEAP